jgi:hypothetical protein
MTVKTDEIRTVRLRILSAAPPPGEREGRHTEFGVQDKQQALHFGRKQPDGSLRFDLEVQAKRNPLTGAVRFGGPFVHGKPAEPFLYLSWKYAEDPPQWIRRQKLSLAAITWEQTEPAGPEQPARFQTSVPPITERTASIPVEWVPVRE